MSEGGRKDSVWEWNMTYISSSMGTWEMISDILFKFFSYS